MNELSPTLPDYRALTVFDHIPSGCKIQPVGDSESDPHLRVGEFAVIDTEDTEPQHGELYLIRWMRGTTSIVQALTHQSYNSEMGKFDGWWTRSLRRRDFDEEVEKARKVLQPGEIICIPRGCMIDGPRLRHNFRKALIGRVIGIYQAPAMALRLSGGKHEG